MVDFMYDNQFQQSNNFKFEKPLIKAKKDKGKSILKQIEVFIKQKTHKNIKHSHNYYQIYNLTKSFYTEFPHESDKKFGTNQKIDTIERLQKKYDLLDNIDKPKKLDANPIDLCYDSFDCDIAPLKDEKVKEMITIYVNNTIENTHGQKLKIQDIFEIKKETKFNPKNLGNKKFLFHGTRAENIPSILEKGLLVAPPGVRHSGSMFG